MRLFLLLLLSCLLFGCASQSEVNQIIPVQVGAGTNFVMRNYINKPISVTIEKGTVDFHNINGFVVYEPVVFVLKDGQIITKSLAKLKNNFFDADARITLRYNNGILYVDELSRENIGLNYLGAQFNLNEAWLKGQTYQHVNTYGFANLRNAEITVRMDQ